MIKNNSKYYIYSAKAYTKIVIEKRISDFEYLRNFTFQNMFTGTFKWWIKNHQKHINESWLVTKEASRPLIQFRNFIKFTILAYYVIIYPTTVFLSLHFKYILIYFLFIREWSDHNKHVFTKKFCIHRLIFLNFIKTDSWQLII